MVPERAARGAGAPHAVGALSGTAPDFTVVVPSRGEESSLRRLLAALARQTLPHDRREIVIALDGAPLPESLRPAVDAVGARTVALPERRGPGAARNRGAAEARGAWLAFTEDDCEPAADWLERAAARIAREPDADAIEGETVTPAGAPVRRRDGAHPNYLPTNLFVRRDRFAHIGGYCEAYFDAARGVYFREDSDFGFALEEAGARTVVAPEVRVTHPVEHARFLDPLRWAARYEMDPLLARRHPARFRDRIEVARIGPFRIRRPVLRASAAYLIALAAAATARLLRDEGLAVLLLLAAAAALLPLAIKWRFRPARLLLVPLVPFAQAAALLRGVARARATGRVDSA
ncbi:MAG: glycosyltransferase family 2 protein [Hyphomicrobiales bacterium]